MQKPLLEHLIELRQRLLYCFVVLGLGVAACYPLAPYIFQFLTEPLWEALGKDPSRHLIYTGLAEAFLTYLKVAFLSGFALTLPFTLWQIAQFVGPGLHNSERKAIWPALIFSPILFLLGASLAYYVVCPWAWEFFLSFEVPSSASGFSIQLEARMEEYFSLILKLILAFGLCFQLPLVLVGLAKLGLLSVNSLERNRKYAFLIIVIVAAVITPPDIISPLSLIIPLYSLYEISIGLVKLSMKKKGPYRVGHQVDS